MHIPNLTRRKISTNLGRDKEEYYTFNIVQFRIFTLKQWYKLYN